MSTPHSIWRLQHYLICLAAFAVLAVPLLDHLENKRPPQPVVDMAERYFADIKIKADGLAKIKFKTIERGALGVTVPIEIPSPEIRVYGEALVKGRVIAKAETMGGEDLRFRWDKPLGGNIRITILIGADYAPPLSPPAFYRAFSTPRTEVTLTNRLINIHNPEDDGIPNFLVHYKLPSPWMPWLCAGLAVAAFFGLRKRNPQHGEMACLVFAALAITSISTLSWMCICREYWSHADPDGYLRYSWAIKDLLGFGDDPAFKNFWTTYPHLHLPLLPLLLFIPQMLGVENGDLVYLTVTALASFGSLLLMHAMVHRGFRKSAGVALIITLATLLQYRFALSFAKPSPDMVGVLLVCCALAILLQRFRTSKSWQLPALGLTFLLLALARPQGITYVMPLGLLAVLADGFREGNWHWKHLGLSGIKAGSCFAAALLILGGLFGAFNWVESFENGVEANRRFILEATAKYQFWSAAKTLQLIPLLALIGIRKTGWHHAYLIPIGWVLFHLVLFPAAGAPVKSTRLYLPVVPAVMLLLVPWCWGSNRWNKALIGIGALYLAFNGFFIFHLLMERGLRTMWEQSWIR